ncbi:hypothetical protein GF351_06560 [Candidatus Woesearchaeota archaeon]|nr:hypothetical protein [Candidatus Woesearchaeota archaeon]
MSNESNPKRSLVDITLDEAVRVLELGEGLHQNMNYQLRTKTNPLDEKFAQLYYVWDNEEHISANFSDTKNAVSLCDGNSYYRTHYRIVKYLEERGFNLASADKH